MENTYKSLADFSESDEEEDTIHNHNTHHNHDHDHRENEGDDGHQNHHHQSHDHDRKEEEYKVLEGDEEEGHSLQQHNHPSFDSLSPPTLEKEESQKISLAASDLNLYAAYLHAITDLVQSIGVLVAGIIIYFKPHWQIADPICTFIFAILGFFFPLSLSFHSR